MKVWDEGKDFLDALLEDQDIRNHMTEKEIRSALAPAVQLRNVDRVFERVF
jgi:adenylosuccinate lyase